MIFRALRRKRRGIGPEEIKQSNIENLLKEQNPHTIKRYISSKIAVLNKLHEVCESDELALTLLSERIMPLRDKIFDHKEALKSKGGNPELEAVVNWVLRRSDVDFVRG